MTIVEFILARLGEKEKEARHAFYIWDFFKSDESESMMASELAEVAAMREIVELHKQWVVAVESPVKYDTPFNDYDTFYDPNSIDGVLFRAMQKVNLMTEQSYRDHFGTEPPTAPMIKALAKIWSDHKDYDQAWS